jgi:hypothetical protein
MGTQPGGVYEDTRGQYYYVKQSQSDEHARAETLASKLYALAGVACVHVELVEHNGRLATASPMIDDARAYLGHRLHDTAYLAKIRAGFAVDAWLANWDVAGLVFDNVVSDSNDNPVRVDTGGCLQFRAMGSPKGAAFGPKAAEWDTLRTPSTAPQAWKLFATMSEAELLASALHVAMVTPEQISSAVEAVGLPRHIALTLIARREDIANRAQNILREV